MPKVASPQKSNALHVAEDRTLRRSEKYGVVGAPLFPGIDLQVDHQGRSELDTRRDVFDRIDKVRGDKLLASASERSASDGRVGTSSSSGISSPQLRHVKLNEQFLSNVLRWVSGRQDTEPLNSSTSNTSFSLNADKRRAVLRAVLAYRILKLRQQSIASGPQGSAPITSFSGGKSALGRGIQAELPDSGYLNAAEDEISSAGTSGSNFLLEFSHSSSKIVYAGQSVSKIACVSVYKHDKAVPKGYVSEVSQLNSDMRDKAVLNYSRDMQEDSYGSAPLRYLQQMSNGPPYTGILV